MKVFESILSDKYILTHQSFHKKGKIHERENSCFQGLDAVSICFHPDNNVLANKLKSFGIVLTNELPAFEQFVNIPKPSIILDSNLLNRLPFRNCNGYKRLVDEIQVLSDIPLFYANAIGYKDITNNLVKEFKKYQNTIITKETLPFDSQYLLKYYEDIIIKKLQENFENIKIIKDLLQKYNYQLPIIDPLTGKIYENLELDEKTLRKSLNI